MGTLSVFAALLLCAQIGVTSALYTKGGDVEILTAAEFDEKVLQSDEYWVVEFYASWCGHCQALAPEYEKAAKMLKGKAKLGAVDADAEQSLAEQYGVKGFPSIKGFGNDKTKPTDYQGSRDADGIKSFVSVEMGAKDDTGSKLALRLEYTKTWTFLHQTETKIPKVILLSKGEKSAPSWFTSVAVKYKDGKKRSVSFAYARNEEESGVARNFKVTEFPSMVFVVPPKGKEKGYHKVIKAGELGEKASANIKAAKAFVDACVAGINEDDRLPLPSFPEPKKPRKVADTKYAALSEDNINTDCFGGSKGMCVIAVVNAPAGDEFKENDQVVEMSKKYRNDPFYFMWVDANTQGEFISSFGLTKEDAPKLVAVKTGKRNRYAVFDGDFDLKPVSGFLDRILGGDMQFKNLPKLPEFEPEYLRNQ